MESPVGRKVLAATPGRIGPGAHRPGGDRSGHPVLADQVTRAEVEPVDEEFADPFDMAGEGVLGRGVGLSERPKPNQVGGDDPQSGAGQNRDHVPVEVAPGRLPVEQDHRGSLSRASSR